MARIAEVERYTKETSIEVQLNLDGIGQTQIDTGVGFFDHMLDGMARHGLFDLTVKVDGDLTVDDHHTIEDTGIVIGQAIRKAVGDKKGIQRYGSRILPFSYDAVFQGDRMGTMSTQMVREFFYAVSYSAMMNLHLKVLTPGNDHHMAEAMFKAFGKALDEATRIDPRITDVLSTKGTI